MIAGQIEIQMMANLVRLQKDMDDAKRSVQGAMADIEKYVGYAKAAFVALAGVASVGAFVGMIRGAYDAAEKLKDLSATAGTTVGALSALGSIGKLSETGIDSIAGAMNKLSKNLAGADEDSKGTAAALRALGLDFARFKQLAPDEQMMAVAKAMDQFADGGGKSAAAMALYGKEGAKLIPMLKDLAAIEELHGKITAEQAEMADNFNDNLIRIKGSGEAWKKQVAMGLLPAMSDLSTSWLQAINGSGGLRAKIKELSDDGSLEKWARSGITVLTYLMDVGQGLLSLFPLLGTAIAGVIAATSTGFLAVYDAFSAARSGDMAGALDALKRGAVGVSTVAKAAAVDISSIWNQELLGEKIRNGMADAQKARESAGGGAVKPKLDFEDTKDAKAKAEKISEYEKLIRAIREKTAAEQAEEAAGKALTDAEKFSLKIKTDLRDGTLKLTDAEKAGLSTELEKLLTADKANVARKEAKKALEEYIKAVDHALGPLEDEARKMETEVANYGLTRAQIERTTVARLEEAKAIMAANGASEEAMQFYQREIDARKRIATAADANDALKAQSDTWKSVESTAHQTFVSIFDSGKSAFDRLRDTLKNGLLDLLYQMTVKRWIFNIAASVSGSSVAGSAFGAQQDGLIGALAGGNAPATNAIGTAGSIGNTISGGNNLYSMMTGGLSASGVYGSFAASGIGQAIGLSSQASFMGPIMAGGTEVGLTALGSTIGMAIPYIGLAIAVIAALSSKKKKKEPEIPASIYDATYFMGADSAVSLLQNGSKNTDLASGNAAAAGYLNEGRAILNALGLSGKGFAQQYVNHSGDSGSYGFAMAVDGGWNYAESGVANKSDPKVAAQAISESFTRAIQELAMSDMVAPDIRKLVNSLAELGVSVRDLPTKLEPFKQLVASLGQINKGAGDAVVELAKAAGGLDALTASVNAYAANYFTAAEQQKKFDEQMKALWDSMAITTIPTTRAEFRKLVESLDPKDSSYAETFTALMAIQDVFGKIADAAKAARDAAIKAVQETATKRVSDAYSALQRAVAAEKTVIDNAYAESSKRFVTAIDDAGKAQEAISSLANTLKAAVGTIVAESNALTMVRRTAAMEALNEALGAANSGQSLAPFSERITGAISDLQKPSEQLYSSFEDYARAQGRANAVVSALQQSALAQKSVADLTLESIKDAAKAAEEQHRQDLEKLDQTLANAQAQIDVLNGIDNSVKSVTVAIGDLSQALASSRVVNAVANGTALPAVPSGVTSAIATGANAVSGTSNTSVFGQAAALYEQVAGRTADPAGLTYWANQIQSAGSVSAVLDNFRSELVAHGEIPRFATGGFHAGGWRMVGEYGPEIEYTPASMIVNAGDTRSILAGGNQDALVAELRALRAEVEGMRRDTRKTADTLTRVTRDGDSLVTVAA